LRIDGNVNQEVRSIPSPLSLSRSSLLSPLLSSIKDRDTRHDPHRILDLPFLVEEKKKKKKK